MKPIKISAAKAAEILKKKGEITVTAKSFDLLNQYLNRQKKSK